MTPRIENLITFVEKYEHMVNPDDRCVILMKDYEPVYMENHDHAMGWIDNSMTMEKAREIAENIDDYDYMVTHIDYEDIIEYLTYMYNTYKSMN